MPGLLYASSPALSDVAMSMSTIPTDTPLLPPFHEEFYFEDGNLTLLVSATSRPFRQRSRTSQVEDTLYKVFRSSFTRHSPVWRELYEVPHPVDMPLEGSGDDHPLILYGIRKCGFERLLWIIYPS